MNGVVSANQFAIKQGTAGGVGTIIAGQPDLIIENTYTEDKDIKFDYLIVGVKP